MKQWIKTAIYDINNWIEDNFNLILAVIPMILVFVLVISYGGCSENSITQH